MSPQEIESLQNTALAKIAAADAQSAAALRVKYLGRNGTVTTLMKSMRDVAPELRPAFGKAVQSCRAAIENALASKGGASGEQAQRVDATLPGRWFKTGVKHPLSKVIEETARIFAKLGFTVADGPDIETRFNNFTALNTPPHHPTNDRTDTFWLTDDLLLRTQTKHQKATGNSHQRHFFSQLAYYTEHRHCH